MTLTAPTLTTTAYSLRGVTRTYRQRDRTVQALAGVDLDIAAGDFVTVLSGAVGAWDRVEFSYARQILDTNKVGGALGLGNDFKFDQDIFGVKVRVAGDAVYGSNWMPAVDRCFSSGPRDRN